MPVSQSVHYRLKWVRFPVFYKSQRDFTMKPYPLGIDNPIKVKGVFGSHKWAIYWADDMTKIATFNSQFEAYQARQSIIESL